MVLVQCPQPLLSELPSEMFIQHIVDPQEYDDELISALLLTAGYQHDLDHYGLDGLRKPGGVLLAKGDNLGLLVLPCPSDYRLLE